MPRAAMWRSRTRSPGRGRATSSSLMDTPATSRSSARRRSSVLSTTASRASPGSLSSTAAALASPTGCGSRQPWRRAWTTYARSSTPSVVSVPSSSGRLRLPRCACCSRPPIRSAPSGSFSTTRTPRAHGLPTIHGHHLRRSGGRRSPTRSPGGEPTHTPSARSGRWRPPMRTTLSSSRRGRATSVSRRALVRSRRSFG